MPLSSTAEIAKKAWKTLWIRFDYRVHNPYLITPKPGLRIKGTPTPSASQIAAIHDAAVYQHSYPASSAPIVTRVVTEHIAYATPGPLTPQLSCSSPWRRAIIHLAEAADSM